MAYPCYGPAWYPQPPPHETKKGVHDLLKAMYLTIVLMVLLVIVVMPILYYTQQNLSGDATDEQMAYWGWLMVVLLAVGVIGLVTLSST
jgi:uncharacterized membrane protein